MQPTFISAGETRARARRTGLLGSALFLLAGTTFVPDAGASCGAAFCTLNTAWEAQGVPTEPGLRFDLRFEYIDQDQPRAGRRKVAVGEISQHHDEVRTLNRNWIATLDYAPNDTWGVSVQLPFVQRDHSHIHNHMGTPLPEAWRFDEVGDVRVLARRRLASGEVSHGIIGGIKLPTGETDIVNENGDEAERSLQPGSGTTDLVLGYYANTVRPAGDQALRLFAQAQVQAPVNESDGFRPGAQYSVDFGVAYPAGGTLSGLLQLNIAVKERDRGEEAEPETSGGTFAWLSPGLSYALTRSTQLYAFMQLPVYQRVNGVQLTADYAAAAGIHWKF